jgi:outer membrane protein assembly factor BamB
VFGPYSELYGQLDHAKMRSKLAYFRAADGTSFLFASGSTKAAEDSTQSVPPSLARLRIIATPGQPPWLELTAVNDEVTFINPGSPVVTSNGTRDVVVWVIDEHAPRVASLLDPTTPHPVLYAFDGETLALIWRSEPDALALAGKYSTPVIAHGQVLVGTDRIQAFAPAD